MAEANQSSSVFFCGKTAFQIARAACAKRIELQKSTVRSLASRVPLQHEVDAAVKLVEARFPGLHLATPVHILVAGGLHCHADGRHVSHACSATFTKGSFWRLAPGVYACTPALAFVQTAAWGSSDVELLQLGFELCGTYCTELTCEGSGYNRQPLASVRALVDYATRNRSMKGAGKVIRLSRYLADGSASPRETKAALLLGLPRAKGGGGLGVPCMNHEVAATREAALIAGRSSFRCDLCWSAARLDVEYQSREVHGNEASRIDDSRRSNALDAMGWQVVNITNDELDSATACDIIIDNLAKRLGKDRRYHGEGWHESMLELRLQLGLPIDSWSAH